MKAHIGPIVKQIWLMSCMNFSVLLQYTILGRYKPSSPATKELHAQVLMGIMGAISFGLPP